MTSPERQVGDRPFFVDAVAVGVVSALICLFSDRLALMSVLVPVVLLLRLVLWLALPRAERDLDGRTELAFFALATLFGAFNDWNSVTAHRVYDYTVPSDLPGLSHIPLWMLLYWGLILRFVLTVFHWRRSGLGRAGDRVWLGRQARDRPGLRVLLMLGLVLGTRQAIYRLHDHALWSWLPFALAIAVYLWLFRPERARRRLLLLVIVVGPAVEALYINVGRLHAYALGWLAGVPLWIALWWGLAALVWDDLGTRIMDGLERVLGSGRGPTVRELEAGRPGG